MKVCCISVPVTNVFVKQYFLKRVDSRLKPEDVLNFTINVWAVKALTIGRLLLFSVMPRQTAHYSLSTAGLVGLVYLYII